MSLQSFAQQKQKNITPSTIGVSKISSFARQKQAAKMIQPSVESFKILSTPIDPTQTKTSTPSIVSKEHKETSTWQWLGKQLMKPVGIVAAESEALGKFLGKTFGNEAYESYKYEPFLGGWEVLSGERESSFTQIWAESAESIGMNKNVATVIGFLTDIVADPLNAIGGGLTKTGKLAQKVTSLKKAGKTVKGGSKLAKAITTAGLKVDDLSLAVTKLEQAQKGQRALIQIFGRPIVRGVKVYEKTGDLKKMFNLSKVGSVLRETFTTKTGIKEADNVIDTFKNLDAYRKRQVIDKGLDIQERLRKMSPIEIKQVSEVIENPSIRNRVAKNVLKTADDLENIFQTMKVKEKATGVLGTELEKYFPHIKAKEAFSSRIKAFFKPKIYSANLGAAKHRKISGTIAEINQQFGKEFFESNPALAYTQRGLASAKARTAKELLDEVGKKFFVNAEDAPLRYLESTNPVFKGLKAEPKIVKAIDQYMIGIQPSELRLLVKGFDRVQQWWKAEVLISPSYHLRNMVGNFWNNFLAGVKNPIRYEQARELQWKTKKGKSLRGIKFITEAGEEITGSTMIKQAQKTRVLGKGWYGADIGREVSADLGTLSKTAKKLQKLMPWKQDNYLFKTNRAVGEAVENNARLAHFIDKVVKGYSFDDAARSVKKFLFDYEDLTKVEKTVFKRVFPFYTWTKKNIPLQLENLVIQPEKFAGIYKVINAIEEGTPEPETEKYMSNYIKDNIPVRIRQNKEGNTEYFLLGNWLPSAQAIDFLSQPIENILNMATPLAKTPIELWANKSSFFKNTLGEASDIEYYYKQQTEFVNIPMRRKMAHLLRNVRVLNDLNKLIETPARDEPENSWVIRALNVLFGKAATYDIESARYFYQRDTEERIGELRSAIKKARKMGEDKQAEQLLEELREFQKERNR